MTIETHPEPAPEFRPAKELDIFISSADEDREFDFKRSTTVGEAITVAVNAFKLDPGDAYDLTFPKKPHQKKPSEPLPKDRTLGSFPEINDGTQLILTARGGGV
jgi:hypothetical protein